MDINDKEVDVESEVILSKPKSSTRIKRVVMDGFKSFAKYTELLMGDEFNIILGPNGSGKSNVLDALCFVLGKSSSKSLRAEKSANLIYNGGKTKNPSKQAEVSIWLDNSKRVFPIQDDDVKISRIVRGNGSSTYKINNRVCTRSEIIELLSSVKVNPDGYNIILQGDITRLIEMSAVERRQIIEEIAGIGIYEEKKLQALNELNKVEEKLNEAEIILKEREGYLKDLRKDRDQALKHKELSDKVKQNKASLCSVNIKNKKTSIDDVNKKIEDHKAKLDKVNHDISSLKSEISERKNSIANINKEIESKSEVEQSSIQKVVEDLRVDIATKKTKIVDLDKDCSRLRERVANLENDLKILEGKRSSVLEKRAELDAQKSAFESTLSDLVSKIDAFRKKHNIDDISAFEDEIEKLEKDIDVKQKLIEELRVKQQNLLREKDKIDFQMQTVDDKIKQFSKFKDEHKEDLRILDQKKKEFKKISEELNELLDFDSRNASELGSLRRDVNDKEEELARLKVKQAQFLESSRSNIAIKKVIENKSSLGGIHGTVADLASVEDKFSVALEIAAANKMYSIIAEDDNVASRAIGFLRDKKIGFASFLPLNKIKPSKDIDLSTLKKISGVFDSAINLIDFDPKFKNAFSHVFGSTIIVKDIDTARKVGIGSVRMVTLSGDLIEKSGAMTGGFRVKKTSIFKEKSLEENISKLNSDISNIQNKISDISNTRQENDDKIVRFRELKATLEGEIIKIEKSLQSDIGDISNSENYKKDLLEGLDLLKKDISSVDDEVSEVMSSLTALKIKKQEVRNKVTALRSPVVLAELNAFEEKKKSLSSELMRVEGEINSIDLQLKEVFDKDKQNTEKLIKENLDDVKNFVDEKSVLECNIKSLEKDLKVKEDEQARFMVQFKSLFEKRNKLSDEINVIEGKLLKSEELSRKEEISFNTLGMELSRLNADLNILDTEFAQFEGIELLDKSEDVLKKELVSFERSLMNIGNVNMRALEIYESVEKEYQSLVSKKESLSSEKKSVLELMDEIDANKKDLFVNTLNVVDKNFRDIFSRLTTKGLAFLELENDDDPFEGGLRIKVKLTGEKFLDLRSLSGGEKTLTALAFLFSIQEHEPAPFYIMDEVDAALDKHNSEKLAGLIRDYCKNAQYIVISHNDSVISEGDVLYGISMKQETGISTAVNVKMP